MRYPSRTNEEPCALTGTQRVAFITRQLYLLLEGVGCTAVLHTLESEIDQSADGVLMPRHAYQKALYHA